MSEQKKLRIGWFTFTCCEDSTVIFTEIMNDHFEEWRRVLDIRHARVLQSKNTLDQMDVAFVEGAIESEEHEAKLKEIRGLATKLVAIGSCAVTGMPTAQRNAFPPEVKEKIAFLLERFKFAEKVKRLDEIVKVDAIVPGCPMTESGFLKVLGDALVEFGIKEAEVPEKF
jgi:sulfhydrogenase subunit delta